MIRVLAGYVKQSLDNMLKTYISHFIVMRQRTSLQLSNLQFMLRFALQSIIRVLIPISKVVGSSLLTPNIMEALQQFFIKRNISLWDARFLLAWTQPT